DWMKALEGLLLRHDLPETTLGMQLQVVGGTRYAARLLGSTSFGLESVIELEIPAGHLFSHVLRVDRVMERLEIHIPEASPRSPKEMKPRLHRLEKQHISELALGTTGAMLKLRTSAEGTGPGFDVRFQIEPMQVRLVRVGERDEPSSLALEVTGAEAGRLLDLYHHLSPAAELKTKRRALIDAT